MNDRQNIESMIDYELLNEIKSKSKCTQFQNKYSDDLRIIIYLIRRDGLSYRGIIEYCQIKFRLSPSIGHIKELIEDGEILFSEENIKNAIDLEEKYIDKKEKTVRENGSFDLKNTKARISELYYRDRRGETTTSEHDEFIQSLVMLLKYYVEHPE